MEKILEMAGKIKDHVNNANLYDKHFKNHIDDWNIVCVALDNLDDTCLALLDYESQGFGKNNGEKYLRLYGTLQAIFLQQDAIHFLYKIFLKKELIPESVSAWSEIRNIRNLTIGHPIEKTKGEKKPKRCTISRITITDKGFLAQIWNSYICKDEYKNYDLWSIYKSYKSEAISYLKKIRNVQNKKWRNV